MKASAVAFEVNVPRFVVKKKKKKLVESTSILGPSHTE